MTLSETKTDLDVKKAAPRPLCLLIAEDSEDDTLLLIRLLRSNGYDPSYVRVDNKRDLEEVLNGMKVDLVISDYTMPQFSALDVIRIARERQLNVPLIVVSGTRGEDAAVETMKAGADDYVVKSNLFRLIPAIEREMEKTTLRKARSQAEVRNQLLTTAIEQAEETVVVTDTRGVVQYANPAFEKISGHTRNEVLGKPLSLLKSGKHDAQFYKDLWKTISSGNVWRGHFKNKRKNGSLYEEEAVISPIRDSSGQITNYVAVKRDVTHEIELEQQLRQSQKLKAIGQFAHKVAHDFTNVLMTILGNAEVIRKMLPPSAPAQEHLNEITKAGNRITSFVAELMAFVHPSPPRTTTIALSKILDGIHEIIRRATEPAIQLKFDIRDKDVRVKVDCSQIEQLIVHIVDNAVDAMPNGGKLTIEISSASLLGDSRVPWQADMQDDSGKVTSVAVLTISDTGCGMSEEVLLRIFEPFFTTKKNNRNIGLGLSTVYKIVEQHKGQIIANSHPGQGSTFKIMLPAAE
jgi:PAS domain S-box-containing protein